MTTTPLIIDSFAGGGGASLGILWATGREPDIAINHDRDALAMHAANHPSTRHVCEDVWRANLRELVSGRPVGLLWASPDCKHFSRAKGSVPVEKSIRSLAWVIVRWASQTRPGMIVLENVREFADWGPLVPRWECRCGWQGTEGQAVLYRLRRRCPRCNSLRLKMTDSMVPDPDKKGLTFRLFVNRLRGLGYDVQWRNLNASDFGAPTHRRRLFLIARRDEERINWPEPTHGDPKKLAAEPLFAPLKPWHTAAECIDWSIPCPSIFERKRPLADKTMRRIAMGIKRYVLETAEPFIVGVGGRAGQTPPTGSSAFFGTVTAKNDRAIVTPYMVPITHNGERRCHPIDEPVPTITTAHRGEHALICPTLVQTGYGERSGQSPRAIDIEKPLGTVVAGGVKHALACASLVELAHGDKGRWADGTKDLHKPIGTIHAGGNNFALVSAFIAKHFGGMVGVAADAPLPTTTTRGTQNQLVAANLIRMNHGDKQWSDVREPLGTITGGGNHAALVYSFLVKYFGTAIGAHLLEPAPTVTSKDRFGLITVTIDGELYVIVDIGMRMLTPRELARAQGFPDSYVLTGTKTNQVARIGNSVCPDMAKAILAVNPIGKVRSKKRKVLA